MTKREENIELKTKDAKKRPTTEYENEMTKREKYERETVDHKWSDKNEQNDQRSSDDL